MYKFPEVECRTITNWTNGFKKLYHPPDSNRQPEEFWNATMAHISSIGEAIRKTHYKELVNYAAHAFCWMCSYVSFCNDTKDLLFKFDNSLSEIVGLKFPGMCGHCEERHCCCNPVLMDEKQDKSAKYKNLLEEWERRKYSNYTIDIWLKDFWEIFSGQIHLQDIESIGFHLLEEAGEEAKAVRGLIQFRGVAEASIEGIDNDYLEKISKIPKLVEEYIKSLASLKIQLNVKTDKEALSKIDFKSNDPIQIKARLIKSKMDFVIELADTFSWFCAVLLKLHEIIKYEKLNDELSKTFHVEESLKNVYQSKDHGDPLICYACGGTECKCLFFLKNKVV